MPIVETVPAPATPPVGTGSAAPSARVENDVASLLLKTKAITPAQASRTRRIQEKLPDRSFLSIVRDLGFTSEEQARKILHEHRLSIGLGSLLEELSYIRPADLETALDAQGQRQLVQAAPGGAAAQRR